MYRVHDIVALAVLIADCDIKRVQTHGNIFNTPIIDRRMDRFRVTRMYLGNKKIGNHPIIEFPVSRAVYEHRIPYTFPVLHVIAASSSKGNTTACRCRRSTVKGKRLNGGI